MSRSSHNLLWNRTHFLSRQLGALFWPDLGVPFLTRRFRLTVLSLAENWEGLSDA
jgi:hypothetical protein